MHRSSVLLAEDTFPVHEQIPALYIKFGCQAQESIRAALVHHCLLLLPSQRRSCNPDRDRCSTTAASSVDRSVLLHCGLGPRGSQNRRSEQRRSRSRQPCCVRARAQSSHEPESALQDCQGPTSISHPVACEIRATTLLHIPRDHRPMPCKEMPI